MALGSAGLAYLRFALAHPAHFMIMNRPDLYDAEDADLVAVRDTAEQGGEAAHRLLAGRQHVDG